MKWTTISRKPSSAVGDVSLLPRTGLGTVGPALQKLVAVQEQPPHAAVGLPRPAARCLRRAARCFPRRGRSVVRSGVPNSFLTVTIPVRDGSCPRIMSTGVALVWLNGERCVLLVILQPLLFLLQPLQVLPVACRCCQGFGERCLFSPGSFLPSWLVCPQLEPGWSCQVPSLRAGRDLEATENGDRENWHVELLGSRRVLGSPGVPA